MTREEESAVKCAAQVKDVSQSPSTVCYDQMDKRQKFRVNWTMLGANEREFCGFQLRTVLLVHVIWL